VRYIQDNIAAIASGSGQAGVGVIRISGNNLSELASVLTGKQRLKPRFAHYGEFVDAAGEIIDSGLIIWFDAPRSFTGEDVLELQGHGSPVVLNMLLRRCLELGCRLAEAGEFTKRAYLNGKLDLVQAESIADLIHAESEATAKGALKSLKGEFSRHIEVINEQLINLRMFVEATLDFPEEDIEFIANAKIKQKLEALREQIHQLLSSTQQGVILNNGANIVIIGRPNVGKSSLLNALANEEVAIVTSIAGTTRDIVRQKIIVDGVPFNIIDTAGIRETQDVVEKIGIERALSVVKDADLALVLIDDNVGMSEEDTQILNQLPAELPRIFVHNKIDLSSGTASIVDNESGTQVYISAKLALGIDLLRQKLLSLIGWGNSAGDVFLARTRHLDAMRITVNHIDSAFSNWQSLEILAEELRYSHTALSSIIGEFSADDLLGEIFSKFCIGK
jgi:tRNA modification GTPase